MTARRPNPDIARLLGLSGPGAWALAALFSVTYTTLAVVAGGEPMRHATGWIALALVVAAAVVLVVPGPFPLPLPVVLAVLGVVAFANVAIVWRLWPTGWPGWSSWQFGACTFLLFMVALRGRVAWGALGMALMMGITMLWSWSTSGDLWHGFDLTYRQAASYAAGVFFAVWLRRTARRIVAFQETEARRIRADAGRAAADEEREAQLERVRRLAGPALERIAAGDMSPADRREYRLLEAELRDRIRGRSLARGPLPAAVRAAREREVAVDLLDDVREGQALPGDPWLDAAAGWAAERMTEVATGSATVRLAQSGAGPVVTFAATGISPATFR